MSVTIEFEPDTESRLMREAERKGLAISDLVREFVESSLNSVSLSTIDQGTDEWWEEFISEEDIADASAVPFSAMSREVLYADRGY